MQEIIPAIDRSILESELNSQKFIRTTNKGNHKIYILTHHDSPQTMREIGRLRELTFRAAGGGTGLSCDIDEFDTCSKPYKQLIVWSPADKEIVGGYRFIRCGDAEKDEKGVYKLATAELFHFSEPFIRDYLPYTIELGRSFVQPMYQPSEENRKGLFSLDNLWDGLGALLKDNPDMKYFDGKVTMYNHFNAKARDMILHFMNFYFPDTENLVRPHHPLGPKSDISEFKKLLTKDLPYKEAHKILNHYVRSQGENIPPLVNSYMNLSSTMKTFGTSANKHFGEVEETCILVTIKDIYDSKKDRHIATYVRGK